MIRHGIQIEEIRELCTYLHDTLYDNDFQDKIIEKAGKLIKCCKNYLIVPANQLFVDELNRKIEKLKQSETIEEATTVSKQIAQFVISYYQVPLIN